MSNVCKNCGGPLKSGMNKCIYCGSPIPVEPVVPPVIREEQIPAPPQTQAPTQPQTQTPTRPTAPTSPTRPTPVNPIFPPSSPITVTPLRPVRTPITVSNPGTGTGTSGDRSTKYDIFSGDDWSSDWSKKKNSSQRIGIILTDIDDISSPEKFVGSLEKYIAKKAGEGIEYCLLDLETQKVLQCNKITCASIVEILKRIYKVAVPNYLLIVGDYSVIPCAEWENECGDGDATVLSDLAYITLDTDSPWDGADYTFGKRTRVGRIPTSSDSNFKEAIQYFDNTLKFKPYDSAKSFAYTALIWERTSKKAFAHLSPLMLTSPAYTTDERLAGRNGFKLLKEINSEYNLLCFNLHGSDATHVWYGQLGNAYPEAAKKSVFPKNTSGYAVCTEACYGARPAVNVKKEQSMVGYALTNNCVAFVGSTRIAYGCSTGAMSCADIIANEFSKCVAKGMTVGTAFLRALDELCKGKMDEIAIKTLAEFALYGDPSVTLVGSNAPKAYAASSGDLTMEKPKKNSQKSFKLVSCDGAFSTYSAGDNERIKLATYSVRQSGKEYMASNFSAMSGVEPKLFKLMGGGGYRAIYSKAEGGINTVVRVHTDENGNVETVYTSK